MPIESTLSIFNLLGFDEAHSATSDTKIYVLTHRQHPNLYARIIVSRWGQPDFIQLMHGQSVYVETALNIVLFKDLVSWIGSRP